MLALAMLAVVAGAGALGTYAVPAGTHKLAARASAAATTAEPADPAGPAAEPSPDTPLATDTPDSATAGPGATPGMSNNGATRPADALANWAQKMAPVLQAPVVALQAYGYAQLDSAQNHPACQLRWTTLAAIGKIESDHGRAQGASLQPDGKALPPIIGAPLNGQNNRQLVRDTDGGVLDGDPVFDHAVGPMQFLPATWQQYQIDADGDGSADPNDIYDAAVAAGRYLCAGGRDLSTAAGWWAAVLSYNDIQAYAQDVFTTADTYGRLSRTVT